MRFRPGPHWGSSRRCPRPIVGWGTPHIPRVRRSPCVPQNYTARSRYAHPVYYTARLTGHNCHTTLTDSHMPLWTSSSAIVETTLQGGLVMAKSGKTGTGRQYLRTL